jgi:hypothetical protein
MVVPAYAQFDDLCFEPAPAVNRVTRDWFSHSGSPGRSPNSTSTPANAPEPPKNYVDTQLLDVSHQLRRMLFNRRAFQR